MNRSNSSDSVETRTVVMTKFTHDRTQLRVHEDPATKPESGHARRWRKTYGALGFNRGYNFPLWIIFGGTMFSFCLARLQYLDFDGMFRRGAIPGEFYWYKAGHYRVGIMMHVSTIVIAGLLMVWQFVPIIRHKFIQFHRINGYFVILLTLTSMAGAMMIVRRSFGGSLSTQAGAGVLAISVTISLVMAWINIKRLQVDQHRAWMLRAMIYMGSIISLRIIMIISVMIVSKIGSYAATINCGELRFMYTNRLSDLAQEYPACDLSGNATESTEIAVHSNFNGDIAELTSAFRLSFGMALWVALFLHMVGTEIYLTLTPRESNRLRQVSYEKQLEAGYKNPGSAGLVLEKFGDADPWQPRR